MSVHYLIVFSNDACSILSSDDRCLWRNLDRSFYKDQIIKVDCDGRMFPAKVIGIGSKEDMKSLMFGYNLARTQTLPKNSQQKFSSSASSNRSVLETPKRRAEPSTDSSFSKSARLGQETYPQPQNRCACRCNEPGFLDKTIEKVLLNALDDEKSAVYKAIQERLQKPSSVFHNIVPKAIVRHNFFVNLDGMSVLLQAISPEDLFRAIDNGRKSILFVRKPACLDIDKMEESVGDKLKMNFQKSIPLFTSIITEYLLDEEAFKCSYMPALVMARRKVNPRRDDKRVLNRAVVECFEYCFLYFGGAALENSTQRSSRDNFLILCRSHFQNRVQRFHDGKSSKKYSMEANPNPIFTMENAF
ncbi:hypothetical protein FO519_008350 [Halicephalobus sp. NKZ332]|nr:hypothetical protein FO519_008350 [Halicephalobus sp. NKZ332]